MSAKLNQMLATLAKLKGIHEVHCTALSASGGDYLVPKLHIMIFEYPGPDGEQGFQGVCLEFGIFSWGATQEVVSKALENYSIAYMQNKIASNEISDIFELAISENMEEYWSLYRLVRFISTAKGVLSPEMKTIVYNEHLGMENRDLHEKNTEYQFEIDELKKNMQIWTHNPIPA